VFVLVLVRVRPRVRVRVRVRLELARAAGWIAVKTLMGTTVWRRLEAPVERMGKSW
jgi:hypothetical protein